MSLELQFRRALISIVMLLGLAGITVAQGEPTTTASVMDVYARAPMCATDAFPPVATIKIPPRAATVQLDWRARMPATIARSRS